MSYTNVLAALDLLKQKTGGYQGAKYGRSHSIYRLGAQNVAVVSGTPIIPAFYCTPMHVTSKALLENETFGLLAYEAQCDNRPLLEGDIAVENGDIRSDGSAYCVVQIKAALPTMWIRCESNATITRPIGSAGAFVEQPQAGATFLPGYAGIGTSQLYAPGSSDLVLTLTAGTYAFSSPGSTPAVVPCGLQQTRRMGITKDPDLPSTERLDSFIFYVPPLPGVTLQQYDELDLGEPNGSFRIMSFFEGAQGVVGNIILADKKPS